MATSGNISGLYLGAQDTPNTYFQRPVLLRNVSRRYPEPFAIVRGVTLVTVLPTSPPIEVASLVGRQARPTGRYSLQIAPMATEVPARGLAGTGCCSVPGAALGSI